MKKRQVKKNSTTGFERTLRKMKREGMIKSFKQISKDKWQAMLSCGEIGRIDGVRLIGRCDEKD